MEAKHTATPYHVEIGEAVKIAAADGTIAIVTNLHLGGRRDASEVERTAHFIVRACNAHDDLVQALKDSVAVMENDLKGLAVIQPELRQAKVALAQAGVA